MAHNDPRELLVHIVKILKKLHIPHIVTGGIAVLVWGRPRFTADIDIIVELHEPKASELEQALHSLGKAGYVDKDVMMEAIKKCGEFNFIDGETGIKVDFWVLQKNDLFDQERLKRKVAKTILGEEVFFSSPEDLILAKLRWYAQAPSSKQKEDAESVIAISGEKLDWSYLEGMAEKLGLSGFLNEIKK